MVFNQTKITINLDVPIFDEIIVHADLSHTQKLTNNQWDNKQMIAMKWKRNEREMKDGQFW